LSTTRHYAPNTNELLTNYSFITHSLALSLDAKIITKPLECVVTLTPHLPVRAVAIGIIALPAMLGPMVHPNATATC
jgi:hypothetical protein